MPAMQFYPADWRKDLAVQSLDYHDRGVWFEMLCLMHESSERGVLLLNGVPMPSVSLARILGMDNQTLNQTVTVLLTYGVAKQRLEDGAIYSKRMVADEKLCQVRREAGKMGGNPTLLKQKRTTVDNQKPSPSSSFSTSSTEYIDAKGILEHLNEQAGRSYQVVKANLSLIVGRLKEGATPDQCKAVINMKTTAWGSDPKMSGYLRPKTLFSAINFAQYVGDLASSAPAEREQWE